MRLHEMYWSGNRGADPAKSVPGAVLSGALAAAEFAEAEFGIFEELRWREPQAKCAGSGILVSRWTGMQGDAPSEDALTPAWCHVVAIALKATRVCLSTGSRPLFDGVMPSGTVHVSTPGQRLTAQFMAPFDFIHLYVGNEFLAEAGLAKDHETLEAEDDRTTLFRDTLVEALGCSLLDSERNQIPSEYVKSVATTMVMRAMTHRQGGRRCRPLQKWRMKRVEQYLGANIAKPVSLSDMATAAGLSKMHFAAQFRTATGFRPHEYLLLKRVELAKTAMADTRMPLVEVAFSVGFNAQAHFSTVFKRFTGKSPAQWRQQYCARAAGRRSQKRGRSDAEAGLASDAGLAYVRASAGELAAQGAL